MCANFEVGSLAVIQPELDWRVPEAQVLAVGAAARRLEMIEEPSQVREAVAGCELAIGFTRRDGENRVSTIELADLASLIQRSGARQVALVFGNEETGLTDDELTPCSHFCRIPTGETLPSMNLSHAVAVVVARVFDDLARLEALPRTAESGRVTQAPPAPLGEMHGFFDHWREVLVDAGLTQAGNPDRMVRRLERFFFRVQPSLREVRLLRGILSKAQYWMKRGRDA